MSNEPQGQLAVRLRLTGQMEAWTVAGENVLPGGRKARALLAVLALTAPRPVSRAWLSDLLWSRGADGPGRASLRQELHRLQDGLIARGADILAVTREHLSLRPGSVWIDVDEVMNATSADASGLVLLDGDLLEGLDGLDPNFDVWLTAERQRVRDRAQAVAENLLRQQIDPGSAVIVAQRLLTIDRVHEGAWRSLMRAHADRGERGMAIEAFDRCRVALRELLDTEPSAETQALMADIRGPSSKGRADRPGGRLARSSGSAAPSAPTRPIVHVRPQDRTRGPAIGVPPMEWVGAREDGDASFGASLAMEITTALTRFRWIQATSTVAAGEPGDSNLTETEIGQALGLDFMLCGTIQRTPSGLRISMRLLEVRAGSQVVWAHRFERPDGDLLQILDEVAAETVARIDAELMVIESRQAAAAPTHPTTPYAMVMRSLTLIQRMDRSGFMAARTLLAEAHRLAPGNSTALSIAAIWQLILAQQGWTDAPREAFDRARDMMERAVVLEPLLPRILSIAGHVRAHHPGGAVEARGLHERALELNPCLPMAWAMLAINDACIGDHDRALVHAARYKALTPHDPFGFIYDTFVSIIHLMRHDHEAVIANSRTVTQLNPLHSNAYKPWIAALGHLGQKREARTVIRRLLEIEPGFTIDRLLRTTPLARQRDLDHYVEGLSRAGIA